MTELRDFSRSQLMALSWWSPGSPHRKLDAVICDGAVRSGKTVCMGLGFFIWAMASFDRRDFCLCGKTVGSLRRNVLGALTPILRGLGFGLEERISRNKLTVRCMGRENSFYLFGGRDESSAALIQGATFAGALLDEVALMPRSFVEQACARCSVPGSKLWFNCNPEGPQHWFYREWIQKCRERRALYIHFDLRDNPGLGREVIERYMRTFSGVFFKRFILGQWVQAQGLIYDFFDESFVAGPPPEESFDRWVISCDYGTANPASFGLWGRCGERWYRVKEYYYASRREGRQKTDGEYVEDLRALAEGREISCVVVDPSAASFIEALRRAGFRVLRGDNDVLQGIRLTAQALKERRIVICSPCADALREIALYCWAEGADAPRKANDHAMDDMRYFVTTVLHRDEDGPRVFALERK